LVTEARKAALLRSLQWELARSVEGEKSAVVATTDEESERFAAQSREAAQQVERARVELRTLVNAREKERLDAFDAAWAKVALIDARLLPLATANTNLKAAKLSANEATAALEVVLGALESAEAKTKDPARLRQLSAGKAAALRVQVLHAPHIASADDAEMTALEARARALEEQVDPLLPPDEPVRKAWADYRGDTERIFELSRQNTNVLSFSLSVHEKSDATRECGAALQALVDEAHHVPAATR
jgi:hypothetical protein